MSHPIEVWATSASSPPDRAGVRLLVSTFILAALAVVYQLGLVWVARASVGTEAAISLLLPLGCVVGGWVRFGTPRLLQLLAIESFFNLMAVATRLSLLMRWPTGALTHAGFALFFVVQVGGFLLAQWKSRSRHGVLQSLLGAGLIVDWWWRARETYSAVDPAGRLLVWGTEAPLSVRLAYVIWVTNVLLVQTTRLPRLHQAVIQGASVGVALGSGEFFHVRLLTACHMFLLDLVFGYGKPRPGNASDDFAVLPERLADLHDERGRPLLAWAGSLLLTAVAILHVAKLIP